jgi:hypothetical protein
LYQAEGVRCKSYAQPAKGQIQRRQREGVAIATARARPVPSSTPVCIITPRPRSAISRPATRQGKGRRTARAEMSFFFRMASRLRPSTPEEVVRSIKDSFLALHTRTHAKVISESLRLLPPFSRASSPVSSSSRAFFFFLGDLEASRSMRTRSLIASGDGIGCAGFISVRSSSLGSPPRAC